MDNQHRKIKGYRELNGQEIAMMNAIKEKAAEVGDLIAGLEGRVKTNGADGSTPPDGRWLAIGKTDLQKGFMALTRSIAKPDFF